MTFTLPGSRRSSAMASSSRGTFDANVNAEMKVGALEETVVVSGASPVVDVQNTLTQTVLPKEQIEVLPGLGRSRARGARPGRRSSRANTGAWRTGRLTDSHTMEDGFKSGSTWWAAAPAARGRQRDADAGSDDRGAGVRRRRAGRRVRVQRRADEMIPKEGGNRTTVEAIADGSRETFEPNNLGDLQDAPYNSVRAAGVLLRLQPGHRRTDPAEQAVVLRVGERQPEQTRDPRHLLQAVPAVDARELPRPTAR